MALIPSLLNRRAYARALAPLAVTLASLTACSGRDENEAVGDGGGGGATTGNGGKVASSGGVGGVAGRDVGTAEAGSAGVVGNTAGANGGVSAGGAQSGGSSGVEAGSGGGGAGGVASGGSGGAAAPSTTFHVFLLIGQSNMAGGAKTDPADLQENPRVKVLGYDACNATGRKYNEWDTASPPLHACWSNGIGPGDQFGKTLISKLPAGDTIGLVPCAIPGVDIDFFRKGVVSARRKEFSIPPDNHWSSAYDWVLERARLAQQQGGVIDGIIFHQGESDIGQTVWLDKVKDMVEDLRTDLTLGSAPFIAGELLYGGAGNGHNTIVNQLPSRIANTTVVSAAGLKGVDSFHFDSAGVRLLGQRYAEAISKAKGWNYTGAHPD